MEFTIGKIAEAVGAKVEGNKDLKITTVCKIEEGVEGGLSFLANPKYTSYIYETKATAVIVGRDFVAEKEIRTNLIIVDEPYTAFATLLSLYSQYAEPKAHVSEHAFIHPTAKIGQNVYIGEFAVVSEGVVIGDNVKIYPQVYLGMGVRVEDDSCLYAGVKVYAKNIIGKNCTIHAGAVLGADGFGFAPSDSSYMKVPQIGNVILEDNVEIGANTCIDKATLGSTLIKEGTKLDNLIQIGHNVVVGKNTVMASQVGISGSTKIGENCMFGGQVGIAGHATIANGVKLGAQSGVPSSIKKENAVLIGAPPIAPDVFFRASIHFKNLDSIVKRLDALERQLAERNK